MAEPDPTDRSRATNDAYTGMLAISLLALIGGSVLLFLDASQYSGKPPEVPKEALKSAPLPPIENKAGGAGGGGEPGPAVKEEKKNPMEEKKIEEKKDEEKKMEEKKAEEKKVEEKKD